MNPIKSLKERRKEYILQHFSSSKYAKKLKELQNIHTDEICFIIGNGPSLSADDLEMIHKKGIVTFGFNRVYYIFPQTNWRPTYYISQDEKMLAGCAKEISDLGLPHKFIPIQMKYYHDIKIDGAEYFNIIHREKDGYPDFSIDIPKFVVNSGTVVYSAIQFASFMGIKEIYLIGVDHHFQTSINEHGKIVFDPTVNDYFCEDYTRDKKELIIPNPSKSTLTYVSAKKFAEQYGFKIYNATRGGKLDVFPRVDFDEVIKKIKVGK